MCRVSMFRTGVVAWPVAALATSVALGGGATFEDDFSRGASPKWGNEVGAWTADGGTYSATAPGNFPSAHSALPFELGEFVVELDVNDLADGGVWLRSAPAPGTPIGIAGVLLVTKGTGLYWHVVADGNSYGPIVNQANGLFPAGADVHLRIVVRCDVYSVHVNDAPAPATSVQSALFESGRLALYDNSAQSFDNVVVVEPLEPCTTDLTGDCVVDGADLGVLLGAWGTSGVGDLDGNGTTDGADLGLMLSEWGPCP